MQERKRKKKSESNKWLHGVCCSCSVESMVMFTQQTSEECKRKKKRRNARVQCVGGKSGEREREGTKNNWATDQSVADHR